MALAALEEPEYLHKTALAMLLMRYQHLDSTDVLVLNAYQALTNWGLTAEDLMAETTHIWQSTDFYRPETSGDAVGSSYDTQDND
jgi:hypothetical protein